MQLNRILTSQRQVTGKLKIGDKQNARQVKRTINARKRLRVFKRLNKVYTRIEQEREDMNNFVKERDSAFIDFVESGSMKKVDAYCKKYGVQMPKDMKVKQAGIYKAVLQCTNIPIHIKDKAFVKCLELGFSPYIEFNSKCDN